MGTSEILQSLPHLTPTDQLKIAETALQLIQHNHQALTRDQRHQQIVIAAMTAITDYSENGELTVFTTLNGEDFYDEFNRDLNPVSPNG